MTWVSRCLLKQRMMEVVVTAGAIAAMQSSSQIITTNKPTPSFLQAGCPSCRQTNRFKAQKGKLLTIYIYCTKERNITIITLTLQMISDNKVKVNHLYYKKKCRSGLPIAKERPYKSEYLFNEPCTCLPASNAEVLVVWNVEPFTRFVIVQQVEHCHSRLHNISRLQHHAPQATTVYYNYTGLNGH